MTNRNDAIDTLAVHAGRDDLVTLGIHALPIDLSTTNPLPDVEHGGDSYESMATGGHPDPSGGFVYQRLWNPTVARFEQAFAALEHGEAAVAFGSGMAAMAAAILAMAADGKRHVVAVRPLYGGTDHLLGTGLLGTDVTYAEPDGVAAAMRPDTGLVIIESPANPTLELVDIRAVADAAGDVPLLVDNTFATPVLQNPLDLGAAMSLHSATKYIGGHGDVIGGVIACSEEIATKLRSTRAITGALMHPLGAYLCHRGLQTLPLRIRAQQEGAIELADWLETQPAVKAVHFPGRGALASPLVGTQMRGPGAMIAIELESYAAASAVASAVKLFTHAVSLGGVDSLIQHPAALTHRPVPAEARPAANVLRISVGLESIEDLKADLSQAFAQV